MNISPSSIALHTNGRARQDHKNAGSQFSIPCQDNFMWVVLMCTWSRTNTSQIRQDLFPSSLKQTLLHLHKTMPGITAGVGSKASLQVTFQPE